MNRKMRKGLLRGRKKKTPSEMKVKTGLMRKNKWIQEDKKKKKKKKKKKHKQASRA